MDVRRAEFPAEIWPQLERFVVLQVVDQYWKEHLNSMEVLRQGIFLRGYGQKDPFVEYKFEATNLFNETIESIKADVTKYLFRLTVNYETAPVPAPQAEVAPSAELDAPQPEARNPFAPSSNPFIRQSDGPSRIPKLSRQERRKLEREAKKGKK
jgi:preprotein translocase subunit SecA